MLERSRGVLAGASAREREVAEIVAARLLVSNLEQDLIPADRAIATVEAHREAGDETFERAVLGVLLGLRDAATQGHRLDGLS